MPEVVTQIDGHLMVIAVCYMDRGNISYESYVEASALPDCPTLRQLFGVFDREKNGYFNFKQVCFFSSLYTLCVFHLRLAAVCLWALVHYVSSVMPNHEVKTRGSLW